MAWAKIDDQFADHPKVIAAGPLASWLYVCGLTYCARLLTDGFIPTGQVRKLADLDRAMDLAQSLVEVGLWEEVAGGYLVHDYLEYNPSKERVLATREARAQAGSRGGKQKASNLLDVSLPVATDNVVAKSYPVPQPVPQPVPRPDPDPGPDPAPAGEGGAAPRRRDKRATPAPDDFPVTPEMEAWAATHAPGVDLAAETTRFLNRNRARGETYVDWLAAWRNWMTSPYAKPAAATARASPNGRPTNADNVAEAKRLLRQRGGPSPPSGVVVEAEYTVRRD